ncbi:hypothetical protein B0T09DRAFT_327462 [Sordaria sp. MPI-SDFR-AT-0083]|nr:hypothetical protein B0T09DRAFT_327462 [Sordaria sp. MPI-SDFR-AT-0083]
MFIVFAFIICSWFVCTLATFAVYTLPCSRTSILCASGGIYLVRTLAVLTFTISVTSF